MDLEPSHKPAYQLQLLTNSHEPKKDVRKYWYLSHRENIVNIIQLQVILQKKHRGELKTKHELKPPRFIDKQINLKLTETKHLWCGRISKLEDFTPELAMNHFICSVVCYGNGTSTIFLGVVLFPGRCFWNCLKTKDSAFQVSLSLLPWSRSEFRYSSERTQNPERGS